MAVERLAKPEKNNEGEAGTPKSPVFAELSEGK